jgi:hypothetical protein
LSVSPSCPPNLNFPRPAVLKSVIRHIPQIIWVRSGVRRAVVGLPLLPTKFELPTTSRSKICNYTPTFQVPPVFTRYHVYCVANKRLWYTARGRSRHADPDIDIMNIHKVSGAGRHFCPLFANFFVEGVSRSGSSQNLI